MRVVPLLALCACARSPRNKSGDATPRDLPSLDAPARVSFDGLGIAHIEAQTEHDAFFLQGWLTARDRMGQMELLRRRSQGRRAEILGEEVYQDDVLMRALDIDGMASRTWTALQTDDPATAAIFEAYAAGVDAHLRAVEQGWAPMSPQLAALGVVPSPWLPEHSVAIEKLIITSSTLRAEPELLVGLALQFLGPDVFADVYRYAPMDPAVIVPDFVPSASPPPTARRQDGGARLAENTDPEALFALFELMRDQDLGHQMGGSNAFAVDGAHSATGHALLESDTHQGMGSPAVYTMTHIRAADTGFHVAGAALPGAPLVLFGTNGTAAWSATNSLLDHSDLYQEVVDGDGVVFHGEVVPLARTLHSIDVLIDGAIETREVETQRVPHHGPVLPVEALGLPFPIVVSARWTGDAPRSLAGTFRDLADAQSVTELQDALLREQDAGIAWIFADTEGHIGAATTTMLPVREALDPTAPPAGLLPGDGGYEWTENADGSFVMLDQGLLPSVLNPARGYVVASNNDPSGTTLDNDPFNDPVWFSGLFDIGSRAAQIESRLDALGTGVTWEDMVDIQLDTTSRIAGHLVPYLVHAADNRPDRMTDATLRAVALLDDWSLRCDPQLAAPTVFHAWLAVLIREMWQDELGLVSELLLSDLLAPPAMILATATVHWLDTTADTIDDIEAGIVPFPSATGRNYFDNTATDNVETRDDLLIDSLGIALDELSVACPAANTAPETCLWGDFNTLGLDDSSLLGLGDVAAQPKAGGLNTVNVGDATLLVDGQVPAHFDVNNEPSNRFLWELDPAGVRGSVVLPGGQSEDPTSPHFADQFDHYMRGELVPLALTEAEVAAAAEVVWDLPAGWSGEPQSP